MDLVIKEYNEYIKVVELLKSESKYKEVFERLNELYMDYSSDIIKLNEKRMDILNKIRYTQSEYKKLLGEGEIKPKGENDDEVEVEVEVEEDKPVKSVKKSVKSVKSVKKNVKSKKEEVEEVEVEEVKEVKVEVVEVKKKGRTKK